MAENDADNGDVTGWQRVWTFVDERRTRNGWNLTRLYDETKISEGTYRKMRVEGIGLAKQDRIYNLCRVMSWTPDSIDAILAGGDPTPLEAVSSPVGQPDLARVERKVDELIGLVLELTQRVTGPGDGGEQTQDENRTAE